MNIDYKLQGGGHVHVTEGLQIEGVELPEQPNRILISGLPPDISISDIKWYLQDLGSICDWMLLPDPWYGMTALVQLSTLGEAIAIAQSLDRKPGLGSTMPLTAEVLKSLSSPRLVLKRVSLHWPHSYPQPPHASAKHSSSYSAKARQRDHPQLVEMIDLLNAREPLEASRQMVGKSTLIQARFRSQEQALEVFGSLAIMRAAAVRNGPRIDISTEGDMAYTLSTRRCRLLWPSLTRITGNNGKPITIRSTTSTQHLGVTELYFEVSDEFRSCRARIEGVLMGEPVIIDGEVLWDDWVQRFYGSHQLSDIDIPDAEIFVDTRERRIQLFCGKEQRAAATSMVLSIFRMIRRNIYAHHFEACQMFYYSNVERQLSRQFGTENVLLDRSIFTLAVYGKTTTDSLKDSISTAPGCDVTCHWKQNHSKCPICQCRSLHPTQLSCGHQFCQKCLTAYIKSRPTGYRGIRCLEDGKCTGSLSLGLIRHCLTPEEFGVEVVQRVKWVLLAMPKQYGWCPTPDCQQVFQAGKETSPRVASYCLTCLNKFCSSCLIPGGHEGMSCRNASKSITMSGTAATKAWLKEEGGLCCPKCGMGLIKEGGCAHIRCPACMIHICWTCRKTFDEKSEQGVYDHMRENHGNIGFNFHEMDDVATAYHRRTRNRSRRRGNANGPEVQGGAEGHRQGRWRHWNSHSGTPHQQEEQDNFYGAEYDHAYDFDIDWEAI